MASLRLYASDLTHSYIALASGTFPLGLAYVASAIKKVFNDEIELELFKYSEDLNDRIQKDKPDVFFFSAYVWNTNLNLEFARRIKETYPDTLVIGGGPNVSKDESERKKFLQEHPYVDFMILQEGEIASAYLLKKYLEFGKDIARLKQEDLASTLTLLPDGTLKSGTYSPRLGMRVKTPPVTALAKELCSGPFAGLQELDDIPSPYVTGLMDKFYDNKLYPLIETNRGCPFTCSFCQQGESYFNKVAKRSLAHCIEEFDFLAYQMTKKSNGILRVEIADPNFAMYTQDLEFCEHVRKVQDKYNWPRFIGCSTGKNKPEQILDAVSKLLPDSLVISNSMQSTNQDTLGAIKRSNISLDGYKKVQTEIHKRGLRSMADVILGLPLETRESHFNAVFNLIDSGVQEFTSYQAMVLKSTDLELKPVQEKYGFKTKWRLLPRAIGAYPVFDRDTVVAEVEQITVETNTLKFDEYLMSRRLHLTTMIYHNSGVFNLVQQYLKSKGIKPSQVVAWIYEQSFQENWPLEKLYQDFLTETQSELFATEQDALNFYNQVDNLRRVKNSEVGGNLLWKYLAVALFEYWGAAVEVAMSAVQQLTDAPLEDVRDLKAFMSARVANVAEATLKKDVTVNLSSPHVLESLKTLGYDLAQAGDHFQGSMVLSDHKYKILSHAKSVYPNDRTGWSLILAVHRVHSVTRELAAS